ncbi:MAG: hypothetical protein ABIR68_03020 [Ilumatobacteraceae bacterium]
MALRDKITQNAQPMLEPGETVQAVAVGQSNSGWWQALSALAIFFTKYQSLVVTDRRIVIFDNKKLFMSKPVAINRVLPRNTQIGPPSGLWWKCQSLGPNIFINKRFHKDIEKADGMRPA